MLNKIWFGLLLIGIVYGFGKAAVKTVVAASSREAAAERPAEAAPRDGEATEEEAPPVEHLREAGQALTDAALNAAKSAVNLCIVLIGLMALWLGMLCIARDAGLVDALARALRPAMRWLFPGVPDGHPAQGAMLMNISANVLGLGNAATPFGLKAMRELQSLNGTPDTATNAMATFLAINTSSVTLVPFTIIGLRVAAGSANAAGPIAGIVATTAVSTTVAIAVSRSLARLPRYRATQPPEAAPTDATGPRDERHS